MVSDPGGQRILQPSDCWNPDERGGIGWPTVLLVAPDGTEVLRARSRDFADRPDDDDLLETARAAGWPPLELGPAPAASEPEDHDAALRSDAFGPYFRGIRFGTMALARRLTDDGDRAEAAAMSAMAASFLEAWKDRRAAPAPAG